MDTLSVIFTGIVLGAPTLYCVVRLVAKAWYDEKLKYQYRLIREVQLKRGA